MNEFFKYLLIALAIYTVMVIVVVGAAYFGVECYTQSGKFWVCN